MTNSIDKLLDIAKYFDKTAAKKDVHGNFIFPKTHPKVKDKKDHFPIQNANHARNALGRAGAFTEAPKWFTGTLKEFQSAIRRKVKSEFPSIKVTDKKKKASLEEFLIKMAEKEYTVNFLPGEVEGYIQIALENSGGDYSYDENGSSAHFTESERDSFLRTLTDVLEDNLVEEEEKDKVESLISKLPPEFIAWPKSHTSTPDDYETCSMCGFDHDYDPEEANKWHTENPHDLETLLPIEKEATEFASLFNTHPAKERMNMLANRFKELERKYYMGIATPKEKADLDRISSILEAEESQLSDCNDLKE